ncbi:MAG: cytochrome P450 [Hyphomicrobiaceae bacterium]|nr:cytochrome P450 [Hyphomicrobiaceae bacterium]MCC0007278.1 cytochrome P450 [Hyphomicrobiaceae bacterium]
MNAVETQAQLLGEEQSVWFKLTPLLKGNTENPMSILCQMAERYGPVIPVNMGSERVVLISEPELFKHVLVSKADNYIKYFDGLKPIFGKSMITHDGALWQKIRMPQQPAFHPDAFADYIPFFTQAIKQKMEGWARHAKAGDTFEMVEQTWTLAADMICKALFDRDMPFNPHVVFKYVKTYTDVQEHKGIRQKKQSGDAYEVTEFDAAKAMEAWAAVPPAVIGADPRDHREKTLLKLIEDCVADPAIPEFDRQQAVDEIKQYLWAGTETTALTLAWALYLLSIHPEAAQRVIKESEEVLGDREPTAADYTALVYTRSVIQETMRLYPPVWGLIRVAAGDDVIGGKEIKAGDRIVLFGYSAHHNPRFWDEPEEFRPERWTDKSAKRQVKYSYIPFGAGKRSCIGGAMSQVENTLALALLLRRFRPEYVGPVPAPINATVTLTPKGGLMFKVHELS